MAPGRFMIAAGQNGLEICPAELGPERDALKEAMPEGVLRKERREAARISEPGVTVEKGCAAMAAARLRWYDRKTSRLCRAAASDQSKRNATGWVRTGGD